ncbi:hypothetical protein [Pedobacter sp. GR22-6]|uniref:hypothetical protein n=1 Tax=Pedobacter sp. GR22-6 TaxID=3127957 RepID=UPI00307F4E5C
MITFVYAVLVFQVLRFTVSLFNFLSNPKLGYYGKHFTEPVSVIISGKRAEATALLQSIQEQDYDQIEIFFKEEQEEETLLHQARGRYFLFLDAGNTIRKGMINNLIQRTKVFDLDLLSLIPNRKDLSFLERCTLPLQDLLLLNLFPLRFVKLNQALLLSIASKSCMFYNAQRYRLHHRSSPAAEPMKLKAEILLANKFVYANDHPDLDEQGRGLLRTLGRSVPVALLYLLLSLAGPLLMLLNYDYVFLFLPLGLIFLTRMMTSFLTAQNPLYNVLLHPLQMLMLVLLLLKACWMKVFTSVQH